ncbi:restriction endonuclease subunit S [Desulfovibrio sp. UIB00]|uniref:restriction endonuclease subunit S n=1 Tax=Desulfovibrio sp. UIB00 TaxID=2804314 RepID=UPI001FDD40C6|nr:restriction endonuclease subunit S [Desulfovibrio sp. UIB00]MCH5146089.1 restriction endonuclease subunit S [Desulfovibrio sp. UIB00]
MRKRLDQVGTVVMGQSPDGSTYNNEGIGEPLLNGPTEFGSSHPSCSLFTTGSKRECQAGDLLFCVRGSTTGRMNRADRKYSLGRGVCAIRGQTPLETKFITYCIDWRLENLLVLAGGGTFPNLTKDTIMGFEIPFPKTRFRIASVLSAYDDLIENNTRRIAILEEMARRIYEEWFVRFRFPGHEQVKMVESELGLIPEGWSILPLQDIATVTMGLSPKGESYNTDGDGIPLINGPAEFGDRFTMCVKWTTAPTKLCSAGDFIVCVRGSTTGKYVKSDGVYCLGRGVCAIKSTWQCFVDQMFMHQLPILLAQTGGSTFPSWTGPQLKHHPVLLPSIDLLSRFESLVQPMNATVLNYSRKNANLRATRDLLLPKLISGELDVSSLPEPEEVITA